MARKEARLFTNIWDDDDFIAATELEQRAYLFLVSQPDMEHSGVLPLRPRRWARKGPTLSGDDWEKLLVGLEQRRFVVVDWDTEEVLVRSLIRRDMVFKEPNVMRSAAKHVALIESKAILRALVGEMARIREENPELTKGQADALSEMESALSERVGLAIAAPSAQPSPEPANKAPSNPSGNPSPNPSEMSLPKDPRGRGSVTEVSTDSPFPVPPSVPPPAGVASRPGKDVALFDTPAVEVPPNAGQLVAYWLEQCKQRPPARVVAHMSKEIKNLLDERISPEHIKAGLDDFLARDVGPGMLPNLVNTAMNRTPRASPPQGQMATTDRKVLAGKQIAAQLRALEAS